MFVLTLNRAVLKRTAVMAMCGVMLAGAIFAVDGMMTGGVAETSAQTQTKTIKVENAQDMTSYFTQFGLEMDPVTVTVDKVQIPRDWDVHFEAFNAEIEKSGLSLVKYKGKQVEKWTMQCTTLNNGEQKCLGVLLVYKKRVVGAYMLQQPSGEVTAPADAAQTAAPLEQLPDDFAANTLPQQAPDEAAMPTE